MFQRVLCLVFCLVCAPAFAVEITSDTVYDGLTTPVGLGEAIHVRGDATLTLDIAEDGSLPILFRSVGLWDNSKLVIKRGRIAKPVTILGNNSLDVLGGQLAQVRGAGNADITIMDGCLGVPWQFTGGTQHITFNAPTYFGYGDEAYFCSSFEVQALSPAKTTLDFYANVPDYTVLSLIDLDRKGQTYTAEARVREGVEWRMFSSNFLPADTDLDGKVDIADLNAVRNSFGGLGPLGDTLPFDGVVGISDLNAVRNSFGDVFTQPAPEPSTFVMALGCIALAGTLGRRRCSRWLRRCI